MFTGVHELNIDDKNRLSIPASLRASMHPDRDGANFYLAPGERERTLELFPERYFPKYVDALHASLTDSPEAADFELFFVSMSALVEVDKQGRVLLPQHHLQLAGIERQVVLMGNRDRLVLRNRAEGQSFITQTWSRYIDMKRAAKQRPREDAAGGRDDSAGSSSRP